MTSTSCTASPITRASPASRSIRFGTSAVGGESTIYVAVSSIATLHPRPTPGTNPTSYAPYAVLDDGRTICISSGADGIGTHCFDTVGSRWERAGGEVTAGCCPSAAELSTYSLSSSSGWVSPPADPTTSARRRSSPPCWPWTTGHPGCSASGGISASTPDRWSATRMN